MATKKKSSPSDPSKLTYEKAIEALERLVEQIEDGSIGLEESVEAYRRGSALIQRCRDILDSAEQEIRRIDEAGEKSKVGKKK